MRKTMRTRLIALAAIIAMMVGITGIIPTAGVAAGSSLSELEAQLKALKAQEAEIKRDLASANSDLSASKERKELLESQIANATSQINLYQQQIADVESQISAAEARLTAKEGEIGTAEQDIAAKEKSIEDAHRKLGDRLRAIAKTGNLGALQRLLNMDNYEEYLLKSKAAECIAKRDQEMMDQLERELADIRQAKKNLEKQKSDIATEKADLEAKRKNLQSLKASSDAKKKELDTLSAAVQSEIRKLQSSVSSYNSELEGVHKKMEEADDAIEAMIKKLMEEESKKDESEKLRYDDTKMWWPVPAVRNISSYYGTRWGTMHRGIDISEGAVPVYGQNIYAAADGEVIAVNYTSSYGTGWSYGYGYCVLVYHGEDSPGRAITTMYAHASKMFARVGDKVVGGKTILAQAGRTGNVTGPHLHFEVRVDGTRVNPYPTYVHPDVNIPEGN